MKKVDLSAVTASNGLPQKSGILEHIQSAYQEAIAETVKSLVGSNSYNPAKAYVLNGVVNSGTGSNYIISAGAIFFNGEVYLVDAASFTITGSNVAVGAIATTYFSATNADPVIFTDGVSRNIHQIRKIVMQPGLSGSGAADFVDFIRIDLVQKSNVLTLDNTTSFTPSSNYNPATKKYVDDAVGIVGLRPKASGNFTVGTVAPSSNTYSTIPIGLTLANANYIVLCQVYVNNTGAPTIYENDLSGVVREKSTTSFKYYLNNYGIGSVDNVIIDWILFQV